MSEFLSLIWVQLTTLAASIAIFFIIPLRWREEEKRLSAETLKAYRKVSRDVFVQVALRVLIPVVLACVIGLAKGNLTEAVINAYLGISLAGGAAALWTVRKTHVAYENAFPASSKGRRVDRLADVYAKNLSAFTAAITATAIGAFGLVVANTSFAVLPGWFWFACFLCTAFPIYAQSWSLSVQFAASKYEQDPKHGVRQQRG
jgi:hypothetical protein